MAPYLVIFAAGFAGSFHCIGMCGGFACAMGHDPRGGVATAFRHLSYNAGRLTTYCFLGALAGGLGQVICTSEGLTALPLFGGSLDGMQRALAVVAGLLMIGMALQFFGVFRRRHPAPIGIGASAFATTLRSLLGAPGLAAPLAFGVFNGFLPCPLVYAFVAQSASTADASAGMLVMAAFGLGTFPAMLAMGGLGRLLAPAWRRQGVRLAGVFILVLGLVTLGRGAAPHDAHVEQAAAAEDRR